MISPFSEEAGLVLQKEELREENVSREKERTTPWNFAERSTGAEK